jgi:uncharacterized protein (DUF433 family)
MSAIPSTESTPSTQPAHAPWPIESDLWDHLFRAWAETLLAKYQEFGGMIGMLIGQLVAAAWRVRHVETYELANDGLNNRDWMRAHQFAQRAFARAQLDLVRWLRLLLPELRRRARLGDPAAEPQIAGLLELPPLPPPPPPQVEADEPDAAEDASTDTFNYDLTHDLPANFDWRDYVALDRSVNREYPVFKGSTVTVESVGSRVAQGWSDAEIFHHLRNVPNKALNGVAPWMLAVGRACEAERMCGPWPGGVPTRRPDAPSGG